MAEFLRSGQQTKTRPRPEENQENKRTMYTGTLIEDLIATVERVQSELDAEICESTEIESWIAAAENANRDPELLGVASS